MILRLSFDLPEDTTYIRTARLVSRCLLEDLHMKKNVIDDIEVVVAELCSNVIRHAKSKDMHYLVTLEYHEPKVVIMVKDTGQGFVRESVLPIGTERPDMNGGERYGGFGLSLLEALSDSFDISPTDPQGTTVRIEKNLSYETKADADAAADLDAGAGNVVTVSKQLAPRPQ